MIVDVTVFLVTLLFGHLLSDFILQSRTMAINKSKDLIWNVLHGGIIFVTFFWLMATLTMDLEFAIKFALLNALAHGFIDWNIWKFYKFTVYLRNKEAIKVGVFDKDGYRYYEDYYFYLTIGIDQFLHIAILFILLFNLR